MKRTELEELIRETIIEILSEETYAGPEGVAAMKKDLGYNKLNSKGKIDAETELKKGGTVNLEEANEDDDDAKDEKIKNAQPTKAELKKNASISKITDALAKVVKDFKATNEEYKKAEGDKKKDLLDKLKDLTEKKKKLEKALKEKEAKL